MVIVVAMQTEIIAAMIPMDMPAIAPVENELTLPALKKRVHIIIKLEQSNNEQEVCDFLTGTRISIFFAVLYI